MIREAPPRREVSKKGVGMGDSQLVYCPDCQTPTCPEESRQVCLLTLDSGVRFLERTCPVCHCRFRAESDADGTVFHTAVVSAALVLIEECERPAVLAAR